MATDDEFKFGDTDESTPPSGGGNWQPGSVSDSETGLDIGTQQRRTEEELRQTREELRQTNERLEQTQEQLEQLRQVIQPTASGHRAPIRNAVTAYWQGLLSEQRVLTPYRLMRIYQAYQVEQKRPELQGNPDHVEEIFHALKAGRPPGR